MSAMIESDDLWKKMTRRTGNVVPILEVCFEKKKPFGNLEDMPTVIYIRTGPLNIDRHPIPATYEVCLMDRTSVFC